MELQYLKLNNVSPEIRLLTLRAGAFPDAIQFTLWHTLLTMPKHTQPQRMTLNELQKTLPPGWTADETHQDQYRFIFEEDRTENTSWTHPDPKCHPASWQPLPELPPLDFKPAFEALSYTWGSEQDPERALVDYVYHDGRVSLDDPKSMTLPIRQNLASALRHLRYPDKTRTFWIDAICINQKDDEEREHQVKLMWLLYRMARRVVVWLGPESSNSQTAMSTLQYLGSRLELSRSHVRYRSPQAVEPEWFRAVCPLPYDEITWRAIQDFLHRSWFERLWIWQEIQLANSRVIVVCGRQEMPWQCLRRAIICLFTKQELPWPGLRRRLDIVEPLTNERGSSSMLLLLNISRERKCFDLRDKIYRMLSVCSPKLASKIQPQYSLSVEAVYKDVFLKYLDQVKRLDLLSGCDLTSKRMQGPSWVPDWSVPRKTWGLYAFTFASGVSCSQTRYVAPNMLQVTGCQAAIVRTISDTAPLDSSEILHVVKKWEPKDLHEDSYITGESLLDAYCTTLRVNYLAQRWPRLSAPSLQDWQKQFLATISSSSSKRSPSTNVDENAYIHWCLKLIRGRKFIETEEGYIGLGPPGALPGDIVSVLLGCKVLMLLRPYSSSTGPGFQVIGECYVHGLDDGVAILGPLPKHTRIQIDKIPSGYMAIHTYKNFNTGVVTDEDPRLQALSQAEYERTPHRQRHSDDPALTQHFQHKFTGDTVDYDPRLSPDALKMRSSMTLRTFDIY